jgi:hypothetical protein
METKMRRSIRGPLCRFTRDELDVIRADFAAYVPVPEIARKLNHTVGTIRQKIFRMGLRRSVRVSRALAWAPPHLADRVTSMSPADFVDTCLKWRDEQRQQKLAAETAHRAQVYAEIDQRHDLSRNDKLIAQRNAGMTLRAIGRQYGLSRERVRQLTSPTRAKHDAMTRRTKKLQTETPETPRDRRLSELYAELGKVMESLVDDAKDAQCDNPEYTSTLVDLSKAIEKVQIAIIGEVMRLHPEEFTQLPNGNWIPNARAINR